MQIFLSWSGIRSKYIANFLSEWIPKMLPHVKLWYSDLDIPKGQIWFDEIQKALTDEDSVCDIVCLTPENLHSDWITFEAGAFLGKVGKGGLFTLLYELKGEDISFPLAAFQKTDLTTKRDFKKMIKSLNLKSGSFQIEEDRLEYIFENAWKDLKKEFKKIPKPEKSMVAPEKRSDSDKLDELLNTVRGLKSEPIQKTSLPYSVVQKEYQYNHTIKVKLLTIKYETFQGFLKNTNILNIVNIPENKDSKKVFTISGISSFDIKSSTILNLEYKGYLNILSYKIRQVRLTPSFA